MAGKTSLLWTVLVCASVSLVVSAQQRPTIPEFMQQAGESVTQITTTHSGVPPKLSELLNRADVVVQGTIGEPTSYLSDDKREVFTDYQVMHPVYHYVRTAVTAQRPGELPTLRVTVHGGKVRFGDLTYTSEHQTLPRLPPGRSYLLILELKNEKYFLVGSYYGAFQVTEGRAVPTSKDSFKSEYDGQPVADVIGRIISQLRRR